MRLVPGRECGECTVCCVTPALYTKEYKKAPGIRCKHLCAVGCSIYPTRYTPCRDYYCGWRYLDFLNDDWRPDKCGVALSTEPKEMVPPPYELGMVFKLDSEPPFAFRRPLFEYVAFLIAANKVRVTL